MSALRRLTEENDAALEPDPALKYQPHYAMIDQDDVSSRLNPPNSNKAPGIAQPADGNSNQAPPPVGMGYREQVSANEYIPHINVNYSMAQQSPRDGIANARNENERVEMLDSFLNRNKNYV